MRVIMQLMPMIIGGIFGWVLADLVRPIKPTLKIRIKRNKIHK